MRHFVSVHFSFIHTYLYLLCALLYNLLYCIVVSEFLYPSHLRPYDKKILYIVSFKNSHIENFFYQRRWCIYLAEKFFTLKCFNVVNRLFTDFDPRGRGCKTFGTRLNEPTRVPSGVCTIQDIDIGPFPRGPGSFYYAASGTRFRGLAQFQVHDAPETPCQLLPKIFAKKVEVEEVVWIGCEWVDRFIDQLSFIRI